MSLTAPGRPPHEAEKLQLGPLDLKPGLSPSDVHVLVVDDEYLSRTVVSNLLRRCDYKVTTAENGAEAMDLLRSSAPGTFQLVLTDVCMPEVDGIQLLQYVKREENLRSVPVIMMSSVEQGETVFECVSSGAEEYLVKPVTRKEVVNMWQHVLRKRAAAAATVPQSEPPTDAKNLATPNVAIPSLPLSTHAKPCATPPTIVQTASAHTTEGVPSSERTKERAEPNPVVTLEDMETTRYFLRMLRQSMQTEAAELASQLKTVEDDLRFIGQTQGHDPELSEPPAAKRHRANSHKCWEAVATHVPSLEPLYFNRRLKGNIETAAALDSVARDLDVLARGSTLTACASLRGEDTANPSEMVCCADFDADDQHFATVSVSRSVKVFDFGAVLSSPTAIHIPIWQSSARSKLSSVSWNAYLRPHLLTADYDGLIQLWDVNGSPGTETALFEEHTRRVWSVDFSRLDPMRFVSGSDDGTVRLWNANQDASTIVMRAPANVCSVQFSPSAGHLVAAGCANHRVYMYDIRQANAPVAVLSGPRRAVSYVRFMGGSALAAASTDSTIRVWNVEEAVGTGAGLSADSAQRTVQWSSFTGYRNERNFVGLAASSDGYLLTGSEDNAVYAFYKSMPFPITNHSLNSETALSGDSSGRKQQSSTSKPGQRSRTFVSSVCWARNSRHALVANSQGILRVLHLE